MSILKVARLGHPVIRAKAGPVKASEISDPGFQRLIDDMIATMREYDGVGLAAPQVHVSKQLFVFEVDENPRYPEAQNIPLAVVINPEIHDLSREKLSLHEGCLSVPDLRGRVPRHTALTCRGLDRQGRPLEIRAEGFMAQIIQHEWDHLQGNVYLDRMDDLGTLSYLQEYLKFGVPGSDSAD